MTIPDQNPAVIDYVGSASNQVSYQAYAARHRLRQGEGIHFVRSDGTKFRTLIGRVRSDSGVISVIDDTGARRTEYDNVPYDESETIRPSWHF